MFRFIRKYASIGFLAFIPFYLTFVALEFSTEVLTSIVPHVWSVDGVWGMLANGVVLITFFVGCGFIARNVVGKRIVKLFRKIFLSVPLIRSIFSWISEMIYRFSFLNQQRFGDPVLFRFTDSGLFGLGFRVVSGITTSHPLLGDTTASIYIPYTPWQGTGYYLQIPNSDIQKLPVSRGQAMSYVLTGGILN